MTIYFHILGDAFTPRRFWKVTEVTKERAKEVDKRTDIDGYIKEIDSVDMVFDHFLRMHFTEKELLHYEDTRKGLEASKTPE